MADRVAEFERELLDPGGPRDGFWLSLKADPPPAEELAPVLVANLHRTSIWGVVDIACLALSLATDPRYRPVVETVLAEGRLPEDKEHYVYEQARDLEGDAILWWFDLLDSRLDRFQAMVHLFRSMVRHPEALLRHRGDRVLTLLSETTRGPAPMTLEALGMVLSVLGRCAPLEDQWSRWLRDGLLDAHEIWGPKWSSGTALHAVEVERCVGTGRFPDDWALIDQTVAHWLELLADPERRRPTLWGLGQVMLEPSAFCGRLPDGILPGLEPGTTEAAAIEDGFRAINRGEEQRAGEIAVRLLQGLDGQRAD